MSGVGTRGASLTGLSSSRIDDTGVSTLPSANIGVLLASGVRGGVASLIELPILSAVLESEN